MRVTDNPPLGIFNRTKIIIQTPKEVQVLKHREDIRCNVIREFIDSRSVSGIDSPSKGEAASLIGIDFKM